MTDLLLNVVHIAKLPTDPPVVHGGKFQFNQAIPLGQIRHTSVLLFVPGSAIPWLLIAMFSDSDCALGLQISNCPRYHHSAKYRSYIEPPKFHQYGKLGTESSRLSIAACMYIMNVKCILGSKDHKASDIEMYMAAY